MRYPEWMRVGSALIIAALCAAPALARQPMYFRHVTLQDGLSQSTVMSILQDSQGFMWLGTENGLNRYDGYTIKTYQRDRTDPSGLASDFIWAIAEDEHGDVWLATARGGVARWNRETDTFRTFRHDPDDPTTLASDAIRTLLIGRDGRVWIGTSDAGLDVLDPVTGKVTHHRSNPDDPRSLTNDAVFALHVDGAGQLWVGTDEGLNRFNASTGEFVRYLHDAQDSRSLSHNRVRAVYEDQRGSLWVGTFGGGLSRLDGAGRFTRFVHDATDSKSLSHDHVRAIFEDDERRLWIGTADGLNLFKRASMQFDRYRHDGGPESLSDSYVMSLFQDRGGVLWVGTRAAGANTWNPRSWSMGHYKAAWLEDTSVTSFATDNTTTWVGTFDHGLTRLNPDDDRTHYRKPALSDDKVMSLLLDRQGTLWIGTMEGGLNRMDLSTEEVVVYRHDADDPKSLAADGVMSMFEDRAGRLWVGTFGGGVNAYDPGTDSFVRFPFQPVQGNGLSSPRATAIVEDLRGAIWVATDAGLNSLDPKSGTFTQFQYDPEDPYSLSADVVYALHIDSGGDLWIGTAGGGLDRMLGSMDDPQTVRFENYAQSDGLPSNVIYGIRSDSEGHLWLSTNNGIARFDPGTGWIQHLHRAQGLQGDEFNFGAHHRGAEGVLFFGGANGFNAFSPELLEQNPRKPPVVLTVLETLNRPAATEVPYSLLRTVEVGHEDDVTTFEFAALDFTAPEKNRYAYLLEGFDTDWIQAGTVRRATYTNLDPGSYTFRVKAANSDGVWNEDGLAIAVTVETAPWRTGWAYAGYALVCILFVAFIARALYLKRSRESEYRRRLYRLAYYDTLTGTPNRHLFLKCLRDAISDAQRDGDKLAVLYIDLDQFKRINDALGHRAGDGLLRLVADRLAHVLQVARDIDRVRSLELARLGGDEFVVLMKGLTDEGKANRLAQRVLDAFGSPFHYRSHELVVTPSIGIAIFPRDGTSVISLLKNADTAMYEAKSAGRNNHKVYSRDMNSDGMENLALEGELRRALENDQLKIFYQPKFDLATMKLSGAEALLRWFRPEHGVIAPATFIPIAEATGLILEIDRWVARTVCHQLSAWQESGAALLPVAINLSGREFASSDLVRTLTYTVEKAGISAHHLELEITESVLVSNARIARAALASLGAVGFRVAVDDFGTGYSSLSYLKRFSLAALKIDRSFIEDVDSDSENRALCSAIIEMAHGLGLEVIAEGVETEPQLAFLKEHGCDKAQGFLLKRPMPADHFREMLGERSSVTLVSAGSASFERGGDSQIKTA